VNPLAFLFMVLGILLIIMAVKGSYGNFSAAVKEL
jgi:hypothetical protein